MWLHTHVSSDPRQSAAAARLAGRTKRRPLWRAVAGLAVAAVVLAACGNDADDADDATDGVLPLLGTPGDAPNRPALAVKVDGSPEGRPQTGLDEADVVFEEMVEGGVTRLLAVYQSNDPTLVGPVRSARSTDLLLLPELRQPLFAWSGANQTVAGEVRGSDLVDVGADAVPAAYERTADRSAPFNLFTSATSLRDAAGDTSETAAPPPLFDYRSEDEPLDGPEAADVAGYQATGGGLATTVEWTWDEQSQLWQRSQDGTPHVDVDGTPVTAANVLIRTTPYTDTGVTDVTGASVVEAEAVGEGDALLLSGGRVLPGSWEKQSDDAITSYLDRDGEPMRLAPGPTWIEVFPPGSGDTF